MATIEEVAQRIERLLRRQGAVPYVERSARQSAQPGYVVRVLPSGAAKMIEVRHLPPSDDALRQVQAYRRVIEHGSQLPSLHVMTVVGASDAKLLIAWHHDPP
jgi:hypothetical protein